MYIHTYTHADIYIYACSYTHIHTHIYAHTYNMYICTHASTPGTTVLQRLQEKLMQTPEALHVSFVRHIQPHLAPQVLALHCTNFLRHQYSSTGGPPFPNIPQNSSRTAARAVLLFHTDQHNRVRNYEEVPHSFTMACCLVVKRLEGKQRCSTAPVGEPQHAGRRARE